MLTMPKPNCRSKRFQIPSSSRHRSAISIYTAEGRADFGRTLCTPEVREVRDVVGSVLRRLGVLEVFLLVDEEDIGYQWVRPTLRFVLLPDVVPEELFSLAVLCFNAAKADEARSVSDDPLVAGRVQVEPRTLRFSRHATTIRSRSAGVVQSTRPTRKITRLPRSASARNVAGVQRPQRIVAQASLSGIGSSGFIAPRSPRQ